MLLCLKIDGIALHILALANVCGTNFYRSSDKKTSNDKTGVD